MQPTLLTKDEIPHIGYTFTPLGGVFYSPKHRSSGRRDLNFASPPKDDEEL